MAVDELLDADEVFCTGTAVVVSPVGSITYMGKRYYNITELDYHIPLIIGPISLMNLKVTIIPFPYELVLITIGCGTNKLIGYLCNKDVNSESIT